jgi:hypothetical protein
MNVYVRTLSCAALLGTALIGLSQLRPAWATRYGLDWWSLPELHEELRRGEEEGAAMQPRAEVLEARMLAKGRVVAELRAGRLTLLQATARFRDLNTPIEGVHDDLRGRVAGATEEERLCRQVILWAWAADLEVSPDAAEQPRARLEAELERLLAENNGIVRLPD